MNVLRCDIWLRQSLCGFGVIYETATFHTLVTKEDARDTFVTWKSQYTARKVWPDEFWTQVTFSSRRIER